MIPIGDDNSARKSTPIITWILILLNLLVFFMEISGGEAFILKWSFIPAKFLADPAGNAITLFTAMFMHAGWGHLIGNMLYLWIFGDNVEDHIGKVKYLLFYLLCGLGATFSQLLLDPTSDIPNLGASGAIAGVLGAYIYQFPKGKVSVMVGRSVSEMPSLVVIGFWFLLQFFSQVATTASAGQGDGVAYMAHIGGFVAGIALAFVFDKLPSSKAQA